MEGRGAVETLRGRGRGRREGGQVGIPVEELFDSGAAERTSPGTTVKLGESHVGKDDFDAVHGFLPASGRADEGGGEGSWGWQAGTSPPGTTVSPLAAFFITPGALLTGRPDAGPVSRPARVEIHVKFLKRGD